MTNRPARVLFVLANGGRGGMQAQVRLIAGALARRGVPVAIAAGGGGVEPVEGVASFDLPRFSARWPAPFVAELRRVRRDFAASIVHGHGLRLAPVIATSGAPRRFVTCHGVDPERTVAAVRAARYSGVAVVACGEGPRALLARHHVRSVVIDNAMISAASEGAVDPRVELGLVAGVALVVLPARFSEQKGHERLVDAMRLVRSRMGDRSPEVLCVGDGPLFEVIRRRALVSNERPLVRCVPYDERARSWMAASDFFVLPSRWEGQPQVVLEALAADLAVATLTSTGVEDLIVDGRNGRRVRRVAELAAVIVNWSEDPTSRLVDRALSREILARHELGVVVDEYLALYRD